MKRLLVTVASLLLSWSLNAGQSVLCASVGESYRECRVGVSGKIMLESEQSDDRCREGISWGTRTAGVVWVDRGCRATFTIQAEPGTRFICESQSGRQTLCEVETGIGVALLRQLSATPCVEGENWGIARGGDGIWVDGGCRAEFVLGRAPVVQRSEILDRQVICESLDGSRTRCPANTGAGVRLFRQLTETPCAFGSQWGYDDSGIWVAKGCRAEFVVRGDAKPTAQALVCESQSARRNCEADTRYGVALVRRLGEKECILDRTWGFDEHGVWVTDGCHGQFALGGFRLAPAAVPPGASMLLCESADGERTECPVEGLRGAGLVRQLSATDCVLNRNWGYGNGGVWVSGGCRAEFAVLN